MKKRDPSIHITKSKFIEALEECAIHLPNNRIDKLFEECYKRRITNRYLLLTNKKGLAEKLLKAHKNSSTNIDLFHRLLNAVRIKRGHRYISQINATSSNYNLLKDIVVIADNFCEVYSIAPNKGYIDFCALGLDLMGKNYQLSKFKFLAEKIFKIYEWKILVNADDSKHLTQDVITYYESILLEKGVSFKVSTLEEKVHFYYTKNELLEHNASIERWVDSQFAELEFMNLYPNPNQLYGTNALKRYRSYIINNPERKIDNSKDSFDYTSFFRK